MKKINLIFIFTLFLFFGVNYAIASTHYSYLYVTIVNKSNNDYLYNGAITPNYIMEHQNVARRLITTTNALVVKKTMMGYSGCAPTGTFSYKNEIDNKACDFKFDHQGVTKTNDNNHCTVTNDTTTVNWVNIPYKWSATITIS